MRHLKLFFILLLVGLSVSFPIFSSDGSQVVLTKTEWEQIQILSNKLTTELETLSKQLSLSQAELKQQLVKQQKLQTQAELLQTSYDALKNDNKALSSKNNIWKVITVVCLTVAVGGVVYGIAK